MRRVSKNSIAVCTPYIDKKHFAVYLMLYLQLNFTCAYEFILITFTALISYFIWIIYLLLKSYSKYMIDREDRQMKIKTQTYHKKQTK